ncbi:MAG: hypothetical protein Q8L86_14460 [Vicinamibacterales bacterium]|nr:hypothetical protein [Vicinamibacterales bacterium]
MQIEKDVFLCSKSSSIVVDASTQIVHIGPGGMLCADGQVMVGYNDQSRKIVCSSFSSK